MGPRNVVVLSNPQRSTENMTAAPANRAPDADPRKQHDIGALRISIGFGGVF